MIKQKLLIASLLFVFVLSGCGTPPPVVVTQTLTRQQVMGISPNWDYIAFSNMDSQLSEGDNAQIVGNTILTWEQNHPNRRIISLQIIYRLQTYGYTANVDGISIYSEGR